MKNVIIGTSMSRCICQIYKSEIDIEEVEIVLFTGTNFNSSTDAAISYYDYFQKQTGNGPACCVILYKLWDKIIQPRKYGFEFSPIYEEKIWFSSYEEFISYYDFYRGSKTTMLYEILYARVLSKVA